MTIKEYFLINSMGILTTEQAAWLSLSVNIDHQKLETTAKGPV
jgi:hypothetical protein